MDIEHFIYLPAEKDKADAVGWVFTDEKSKMQKYYFTFPEIEDCEVRVKILYTSVCQSDILTVRGNWGKIFY